jgi:hypothetical protein
MIPATCLFDGTVNDALCAFRDPDQRDVEIVDVHGSHHLWLR